MHECKKLGKVLGMKKIDKAYGVVKDMVLFVGCRAVVPEQMRRNEEFLRRCLE